MMILSSYLYIGINFLDFLLFKLVADLKTASELKDFYHNSTNICKSLIIFEQ